MKKIYLILPFCVILSPLSLFISSCDHGNNKNTNYIPTNKLVTQILVDGYNALVGFVNGYVPKPDSTLYIPRTHEGKVIEEISLSSEYMTDEAKANISNVVYANDSGVINILGSCFRDFNFKKKL